MYYFCTHVDDKYYIKFQASLKWKILRASLNKMPMLRKYKITYHWIVDEFEYWRFALVR